MNSKYVYFGVLMIVITAWFGHSTSKPVAKKEESNQVVSNIVGESESFGIINGEWSSGGHSNIEYINGQKMTTQLLKISKETPLCLSGWAMDVENRRLPKSVVIRFEGEGNTDFFALANSGLMRLDVADYFTVGEELAASGYQTNINLSNLPSGKYTLTLLMKFIDCVYVHGNGRKIIVQ